MGSRTLRRVAGGCREGGGGADRSVGRGRYRGGGPGRACGTARRHSRPSGPAPNRRPGDRRRRSQAARCGRRCPPRPVRRRTSDGGERAHGARMPRRLDSSAARPGCSATTAPEAADIEELSGLVSSLGARPVVMSAEAPRSGGGGDQSSAPAARRGSDRIARGRARGGRSRFWQLPRSDQGCAFGAGMVVRGVAGEPHRGGVPRSARWSGRSVAGPPISPAETQHRCCNASSGPGTGAAAWRRRWCSSRCVARRAGELAAVGRALATSRVDVRDLQLRHSPHGGGGVLAVSVRPGEAGALRRALSRRGFLGGGLAPTGGVETRRAGRRFRRDPGRWRPDRPSSPAQGDAGRAHRHRANADACRRVRPRSG